MILVTGGTGLVGSNLLYFLSLKGYKIKAIKRENSNTMGVLNLFNLYDKQNALRFFDAIEWIDTDLFSTSKLQRALEGVEQVYHAAGLVSFNMSDLEQLKAVNKTGTFNLVNVCLKSKVKSICFISSVSVLSQKNEQEFITEEFGSNQENSYYGYTKTAAEMEIWRSQLEGLDVVVVNPSVILGYGPDFKTSAAFFNKQKLLLFYPPGGTGFVDVRDVATLSIQLMEEKKFNQRYILNSENKSYKEIFTLLRKEMNLPKPKLLNKYVLDFFIFLVKIKSIVMLQSVKMNTVVYESTKTQTNYSNEKIIKTLNCKFISIEDSIKFHTQNKINSIN